MSWYERCGPGADVFISTRVRVARNLEGYPFEGRLTEEKAKEMIEKVKDLFPEKDGYTFCDMGTLSPTEALSLAEKHYISREFAHKKTPHGLIRHAAKGLSVMVCEEDHLRIQCLATGLSVKECFEGAYEAEERLAASLDIAYDDTLGYLTHCPTNLGTGMRVSVMLFLPALSMAGKMPGICTQLQKLGLVARGMLGEGSDFAGYLYQISNQVTLGISEEQTGKKVTDIVKQIAELERSERKSLPPADALQAAHRAGVAEGTFRYGRKLSTAQFFALWADLRLGVCLGASKGIDLMTMDKMFFEAMPATVTLLVDNENADLPAETKRDITRCLAIQKLLNHKEV